MIVCCGWPTTTGKIHKYILIVRCLSCVSCPIEYNTIDRDSEWGWWHALTQQQQKKTKNRQESIDLQSGPVLLPGNSFRTFIRDDGAADFEGSPEMLWISTIFFHSHRLLVR